MIRIPDYPATRGQYVRLTRAVREACDRLPLGDRILRAPTILCAALYAVSLIALAARRDTRLVRAVAVPAACFLAATALRLWIDRERPYDRFDAPPVGRCVRGKGRSLPSRHTASAVAIACAAAYAFPVWPVIALCAALSLVIAALRVACGQHTTLDVLAAIALSLALSAVGYGM